jgi:hypothetical protein
MVKKQTGRKTKGNLLTEIDAAIALLTRVRALAASAEASAQPVKQGIHPSKATLLTDLIAC